MDFQKLNSFIQVVEGVPTLRELIEIDDFIWKIDLKDAYLIVPIDDDSKDFLSFENKGVVHRYKSLAFGLSVSPRIFSKIMRYAIEPLGNKGIQIIYYLDDICIFSKTKLQMIKLTMKVRHHLKKLGFSINYKKRILKTSKTQVFLWFSFNRKTMIISVPTFKISNLLKRIRQMLKTTNDNMPVDIGPTWEDDLDDTSNRRSSITHQIPSAGLIENIMW